MHAVRDLELLKPDHKSDLRVQVVFRGALADQLRKLGEEYQSEIAPLVRAFVVDGLLARGAKSR